MHVRVVRVAAMGAGAVLLTLTAAGCQRFLAGDSTPKPTLSALLKGMNADFRPARFSVVHRFATGDVNVSTNDKPYDGVLVEWVPRGDYGAWAEPGGPTVPITASGLSGGWTAYGHGISGGLCDYIKSYSSNMFLVYTFDSATSAACKTGNAKPHGSQWAHVDSALSKIAGS